MKTPNHHWNSPKNASGLLTVAIAIAWALFLIFGRNPDGDDTVQAKPAKDTTSYRVKYDGQDMGRIVPVGDTISFISTDISTCDSNSKAIQLNWSIVDTPSVFIIHHSEIKP